MDTQIDRASALNSYAGHNRDAATSAIMRALFPSLPAGVDLPPRRGKLPRVRRPAEKVEAVQPNTERSRESVYLDLLKQLRLPTDNVAFSKRREKNGIGEELVGTMACPNGHVLSLSTCELRALSRRKFLQDASIVPTGCPLCAYPGVRHVYGADACVPRSTVFHRLAVLKKLYPDVFYVSGFDSSGDAFETYGCGRTFANGAPHRHFTARYKNLMRGVNCDEKIRHLCKDCRTEGKLKKARSYRVKRAVFEGESALHRDAKLSQALAILRKTYPGAFHVANAAPGEDGTEAFGCGKAFADGTPHPQFMAGFHHLLAVDQKGDESHYCYVCSLQAGKVKQMRTKARSIDMLTARMKWIAEALTAKSGIVTYAPSVERLEGAGGALLSVKTKLRFHCGNPGHRPIVRTPSNFFGWNHGGYCPKCLVDHGVASTADLDL